MCLLTFRSVKGAILVFIPLALVSVLAYALMALVGIGLKISTLPMVALGVGIGVDYGIYLFSRMQEFLKQGLPVREAFEKTMRVTGASIIFTGITLAIGVVTWIFSPLQFQADIGKLLTFMFLVNMIGAIVLLPALATWMIKPSPSHVTVAGARRLTSAECRASSRSSAQRRFAPFFGAQALGAFNDNLLKNSLVILAAYQGAALTTMDPGLLSNLAVGPVRAAVPAVLRHRRPVRGPARQDAADPRREGRRGRDHGARRRRLRDAAAAAAARRRCS